MKTTRRITILATSILIAQSAWSAPVIIGFDDLPSTANQPYAPVNPDSQLIDQYRAAYGVAFTSGGGFASVVDIGSFHAISGVNALGGSTSAGLLTYDRADPIVARFFVPSNPSDAGVTDFVSLRVDLSGEGQTLRLDAFDIDGQIIATDTAVDIGGAELSVAHSGIHEIRFSGISGPGGAAVDNFTFQPVTALPEPGLATTACIAALGPLARRHRHARRAQRAAT